VNCREQVEDLQKEIQKIEADYRRQVSTVIAVVLTKYSLTKCIIFVETIFIMFCI